jgi:hypothetical protein
LELRLHGWERGPSALGGSCAELQAPRHCMNGGRYWGRRQPWEEQRRQRSYGGRPWLRMNGRGFSWEKKGSLLVGSRGGGERWRPWRGRAGRWRGGERGEGGLPFIELELWTWQTAPAGGRCDSVSIGRQFSSFSVWNRTRITAEDLFLVVYSTNRV